MFGMKGYLIEKHSRSGQNVVFHLSMRDDNIVFVTDGYDIVKGRVHMNENEANEVYAKYCVELGIAEKN